MRMFKRILIGGIIGDLIPNTFSFSAITGAALNTAILSGPITISGINGPTPVSCTGGVNVSINGGAYVSSGTITNGQTIQAKLTSSNAYTTLVTGNVNIGGVIAAFNVTTSAQPATISSTAHNASISVNGNIVTSSGTGWVAGRADIGISSGKKYWEVRASSAGNAMMGIISALSSNLSCAAAGYLGTINQSYGAYIVAGSAGQQYNNIPNAVTHTSWGSPIVPGGVVIGFALDMDAGTLSIYRDGVFQVTVLTGLSGTFYPAYCLLNTSSGLEYNFGAGGWWKGIPSGYSAIQ